MLEGINSCLDHRREIVIPGIEIDNNNNENDNEGKKNNRSHSFTFKLP